MSIDVVAENARVEGRITWNDLRSMGHGDINAQGFVRQISVAPGETVEFSADGGTTTIDIYRCGWYGGDGFRQWGSIENTPTIQPEAEEIPGSYGATTCTNWSVTAQWEVPEDAVSGMYLALFRSVPPYAPNAFYATFVVRDDLNKADILYKTSDSTWNAAYNHYGTKANIDGKNVYGSGRGVGNIQDRSVAVDYHRPVITRGTVMQTFWWACEMPLIRWLERNGYSVKYNTCVDLDKRGVAELVDQCDIFLSSGHDEYWTQPMRDAVETWRDVYAGKSIFMSGNEVLWRARYTYDGDRAVMWCYKDTMPGPSGSGHISGQPLDPETWTGTWMDTRWPDNQDGAYLTGTKFGMNGVYDYDAVIPRNPYGGHKVWGGTSLNDSDITIREVLGFEADHLYPTQPDVSAKILAAYSRSAPGGLSDENGEYYDRPGTIDWGIISQRYSSGGVTVGFGTCQWSWVLDNLHDRGSGTAESLVGQQFTTNLLRDLGAEPGTLQSGVVLQPVNSLDEYGAIPSSEPEPEPEPEPNPDPVNGVWRFHDGKAVRPKVLVGGRLVNVK